MSAASYAKPTDEIGADATVTLTTGTADSHYPVTNVQNFNPDQVFLTTTTLGADLVFDHGAATLVEGFSLHHHNLPAGTVIRIQRNATNAWGGPSINEAHTIGAYPNPGLPLPIGVDLRTVSGHGSYRYSRLHVPAIGSPGQLTGLGSALWWARLRDDLTNVRYPVQDGETHPKRRFPTAYGHKREYRLGVRLRRQPATFTFDAATYARFLSLFRSCQDGDNAFLWWRHTTGSDAMLATWDEDDLQREINPRHSVTVTMIELGCGLAIPTA